MRGLLGSYRRAHSQQLHSACSRDRERVDYFAATPARACLVRLGMPRDANEPCQSKPSMRCDNNRESSLSICRCRIFHGETGPRGSSEVSSVRDSACRGRLLKVRSSGICRGNSCVAVGASDAVDHGFGCAFRCRSGTIRSRTSRCHGIPLGCCPSRDGTLCRNRRDRRNRSASRPP
jgi:hypothetical protein